MFGNTISMAEKALSYLYKKEEVLMNNMANVSTPGFKRTDVSFEEEFRSKLIEASGSKSSRAMPDAIAESNYTLYSRDDSARVDENNVKLSIEIEDTGRGIHKEDIDKLFVPYEHFDENENQTIEGTGLGLPIANDLVKLMGGNIEVKSQYGKGSKFIINILQKVVRWEEDGIKEEGLEQKNQGRTFIAPDARVLVVDDMPANLLVANELLKRTQIKVDMAKRGADCLKMIEKKSYQIIFLDHMMPEMDGIELLKRIREFKDNPNSSVPIIVMTANAVLGSREMYLDAGFTDYISKPVYYEELERLITKYLPDGMYTYIDTDNQESGKGAVIVD